MKLKLSMAQVSLTDAFRNGTMDLESYLDFCSELELDGADLLNYPHFWKDKQSEQKKVRDLAAKRNLALPCYGVNCNFTTSDKNKFSAAAANVREALCEANEMHIPLLRIFGGHHQDQVCGGEKGMGYLAGARSIIAGISEVLPYAEKYGVILALENHGRLPGHPWELEMIARYFNNRHLRILLDVGNLVANNMDEPVLNAAAVVIKLFPFLVHMHVKDMRPALIKKERRIEAAVAGQGIVPFRQIMAALHELGYCGFLGLEYEASFILPEKDGCRESIAYLKEVRDTLHFLSGNEERA